jgi:hypothetical protein
VTSAPDSDASRPSRRRALLIQLALSIPELAIAGGFGFAAFWGATAFSCRLAPAICDSAGGLVFVIAGIVVGILCAGCYWVAALALGLAGKTRVRYTLDAVVAAVAAVTYGSLVWQAERATAASVAAAETAARNEAIARERWIAALQQNPDAHGPPGVVPPMLEVVDDGRSVRVTNTTSEWLTVALARVLQDNQGAWHACPLLTVGEVSDYYRFSIGPGNSADYAPLPGCAAGFDGAPLEYRVGDPVLDRAGFWSDTAFAVPNGRLP